MDKVVEAVIEAAKSASPMLWAAAQQKVQTDLFLAQVYTILSGIVLLGVIVGIFYLVRRGFKEYEEGYFVASALVSVLGLLPALPFFTYATKWYMIHTATQWYTIKTLVELSPLK